MRLLIAEDNPVSRLALERMLSKWGHEVVTAEDGNQAWQKLQTEDAPSLMILDWDMPKMDGLELCRRIRQRESRIRPYIILLTAMDQKEDLVKAFEAEVDDYITKPFNPDELRARMSAALRVLEMQDKVLKAEEALRHQATHDSLTSLSNRFAILSALDREFSRAQRTGNSVSVIMADLDLFKQVNDNYGHQAGDAILQQVATRMKATIRRYDEIGRYGGEEFMVVLSGCGLPGAQQQAERLRSAVADSPFDIPDASINVTLSLGVACIDQMEKPSQELLVRMADTALYSAKADGRNCVRCAVSKQAQTPV